MPLLNFQTEYPLKTYISVEKSYEFLIEYYCPISNVCSKLGISNRKFNPTGICDAKAGLVVMNNKIATSMKTNFVGKIFQKLTTKKRDAFLLEQLASSRPSGQFLMLSHLEDRGKHSPFPQSNSP